MRSKPRVLSDRERQTRKSQARAQLAEAQANSRKALLKVQAIRDKLGYTKSQASNFQAVAHIYYEMVQDAHPDDKGEFREKYRAMLNEAEKQGLTTINQEMELYNAQLDLRRAEQEERNAGTS